MSEIFFCSDHHFNHDKEFVWKRRGFNSVEEMNETIVENHNQLVKPNDIVYMCGDLMLGSDTQAGLDYVRRMNGVKFLVVGNHDTDSRIEAYRESGLFQDIQFGYRLSVAKRHYLVTHYPTLVENYDKIKLVNIHGHTHMPLKFEYNRQDIYNVSMEAQSCRPIDLDSIRRDIVDFRPLTKDEKIELRETSE